MHGETIRTDAKGNAVGWVFGVPSCVFRSAMGLTAVKDETRRERQPSLWRRPQLPLRAFKVGDIFYDPPPVRNMVWNSALKMLRRCAQVISATPDRTDARSGGITPGQVDFKVTHYERGVARRTTKHRATQSEFEELLRTGNLPTSEAAHA